MPSIILSYGSGAATSRTFSKALSVKGFKPGDAHEVYPRLRPEYVDGGVRKFQAGFRRIFIVDLGVVTDGDDLDFLGLFLNNEYQYLTYTYTLDYASASEGTETITGGSVGAGYVQFDLVTDHNSWTVGDTVAITSALGLSPSFPDGNYAISAIPATNSFRVAEAGYSGAPTDGDVIRVTDSITETDLRVVDNHPQWASPWESGVAIGSRFVLALTEADMRTSYPT